MKKRIERIGSTEYLEIKRSARQHYVVLPEGLVDTFGLKHGDRLKIQIVGKVIEQEVESGE